MNRKKIRRKTDIVLLDLFCKAGGCSVGYMRAAAAVGLSIEIFGVDIEHQPNYPFNFIQGDALEFVKYFYQGFTHIHASPPCQAFSRSTVEHRLNGRKYPDLLTPIRPLLLATALPGVIENVPMAPLRPDIELNGQMFRGLKVIRSRKFELFNWFMMKPSPPQIKRRSTVDGNLVSVYGNGGLTGKRGGGQNLPGKTIKERWSGAMGIDWMTTEELREAIPPQYTEYIGREMFRQMVYKHATGHSKTGKAVIPNIRI